MIPGGDSIQAMAVSYSLLFACVGVGFVSLRQWMKSEVGPGYWALGIFANAVGFVFWSGSLPLPLPVSFLLGEMSHITGFFLLVVGAYRFTGHRFRAWNWVFLGVWLSAWLVALALFSKQTAVAMFLLRALRSVLFLSSGALLLRAGQREKTVGVPLAGMSLVAWGGVILLAAIVPISPHISYGLLIGAQLVACLGMVAMVLDKMRIRAEKSEEQIRTLEGMLPICSYCKKIRDENDEWHKLEAYIENRSAAEFTHGICPDCFSKHNPSR